MLINDITITRLKKNHSILTFCKIILGNIAKSHGWAEFQKDLKYPGSKFQFKNVRVL